MVRESNFEAFIRIAYVVHAMNQAAFARLQPLMSVVCLKLRPPQ